MTLRSAIEQIDKAGGTGAITFAPNVTTVTLTGSSLTLTTPKTNITINGANAVTIQEAAGQAFGLFTAGVGTTLKLQQLDLLRGAAAGGQGGGVNAAGALTIQNCDFSACSAVSGGAVFFSGSALTVSSTTFTGDSASQFGGGVYITGDGTATIAGSTFTGCTAADGGGLTVANAGPGNNAVVTVSNSTLQDNSAVDQGAGILISNGTVTLSGNTQVTGNYCTDPVAANQKGGGINLAAGTLTLNGVWVGGNTATAGSGMYQVQNGTDVVVGPNGVTWYINQVTVGPA